MNEKAQVWQSCYTCRDYSRERREVIAVPLADKARRTGRDVIDVVDEFMLAAHHRHIDTGEPLRPGGPTRVTDPLAGRLLATYAMLGASLRTPPGQPAENDADTNYGVCWTADECGRARCAAACVIPPGKGVQEPFFGA